MHTWTTIEDKSAWGDGPWVDEPDKAQWTDEATGLPCLAKRSEYSGAWCGYVAVSADHPLHGVDYEDVPELEAHGFDVNYSAPCQEDGPIEQRICHEPEPGEPDDVWWFGFDCHHLKDVGPAADARCRKELGVVPALLPIPRSYRTLEYVRSECVQLAQQLAHYGRANGDS